MVISYSVQRARKSVPLLCNIDRIVPLSLEFLKRHLTRSKVFPNLSQTYRTLESSLLFFFCFVHLNHCILIFSLQMYELSLLLPNKNSKTCQRAPLLFLCLFHRSYHRFDELDFLIRQSVLLIEFLVSPRLAEVLEGDKHVTASGYILSILY